jgi:hypothetical protein
MFTAVPVPRAPAQEALPHVHLVLADSGDPSDPCHTGDKQRESLVGDHFEVFACVRNSDESPYDTNGIPPSLRWTIRPADNGEITASAFEQTPPQETSPDGTATAKVGIQRVGHDEIVVELLGEQGVIASDQIDIRVVSCLCPCQGCGNQLTIRFDSDNQTFKGAMHSEQSDCRADRRVSSRKRVAGRDIRIGVDATGRRGFWSVSRSHPHGRFYAIAFPNGSCLPDRSVTIRV